MQDFLSEFPQDKKSRLILALIFLFPIFIATVKGASSLILLLLFLLSFGNFRNNWRNLLVMEQSVLLGVVILGVAVALSLFLTEDFAEGSSKLERYLRLILIIPVYFALRAKNLDSAKILLLGAFIACFVMAGQAVYEVVFLQRPIVFGAYHRIVFGNMAVIYVSLIAMTGLIICKKHTNTIYLLTAILAGGYAVFMSGSRSAILFIPIAVVAVLLLYRQQISKKTWIVIATILVMLTIILGTQQTKVISGIQRGLSQIESYQQDTTVYTSWGARLNMWYNSWQVFKTAPVLGTGVGDYYVDVQKLLKQGHARHDGFAENQTNTHSIYFQTLAEGGTVGIILLLVCLVILPIRYFYYYWRHSQLNDIRLYSIAGLLVVFAFAWLGVSEGWLNRNPLVNSYAILLAVFMSSIANKVKPFASKK